ncbi:MAG: hypothetical protein M3R41_00925 [Pseudomonadota bacterium]|nr:hypothetical protein [Pseudomonadota bacterium]
MGKVLFLLCALALASFGDLLFLHGEYTSHAYHSVYDSLAGVRDWSADLWGTR